MARKKRKAPKMGDGATNYVKPSARKRGKIPTSTARKTEARKKTTAKPKSGGTTGAKLRQPKVAPKFTAGEKKTNVRKPTTRGGGPKRQAIIKKDEAAAKKKAANSGVAGLKKAARQTVRVISEAAGRVAKQVPKSAKSAVKRTKAREADYAAKQAKRPPKKASYDTDAGRGARKRAEARAASAGGGERRASAQPAGDSRKRTETKASVKRKIANPKRTPAGKRKPKQETMKRGGITYKATRTQGGRVKQNFSAARPSGRTRLGNR